MTPADISTSQLDEIMRRGRQIESDSDRDEYFAAVVAALRERDSVEISDVRKIVGAAFRPYAYIKSDDPS